MNNKNIIIFVISIFALLGGFFWFFYNYFSKKRNLDSPTTGNVANTIATDELSQKVQLLKSELDSIEDRIQNGTQSNILLTNNSLGGNL